MSKDGSRIQQGAMDGGAAMSVNGQEDACSSITLLPSIHGDMQYLHTAFQVVFIL